MSAYDPKPIDTAGVQLEPELRDLLEKLTRNAHDVWAHQRFSDGWRWGRARNDERREHPSLVAFEDLPASEQLYDKIMVEQAIKGALALGYKIERG